MKTIRCSALPAAFTCPGSVQAGEVEIDAPGAAAEEGSAAHEVMQAIVDMDARSIDGVDLVSISRKYSVDVEELRIRAFMGLKVWAALRDELPAAQAEVELVQQFDLDGTVFELTGHVDALSVIPHQRRAHLGDWKFGRVDRNHAHQVRGYMALTLATYPEIDTVKGFVGWMLAGEIEHYSMDREGMWAWLDEVKRVVMLWDGVFHPSDQCAFCHRNHDCKALLAMARRDVLVLGGAEMADRIAGGIADLSDRDLIALYRRGRVISRVIDGIDKVVRSRVEAAGVLPDGEGRELRFTESAKRLVDPVRARPVLEARLSEEEIAACTVLRPSLLDDAVAGKAERGKKKAAIEELDVALRAADAITEEKSKRLMDLRTKEG